MSSEAILKISGVRKEFPITRGIFSRRKGSIPALGGVSLDLQRGTTAGVAGESGSGKTTLIRCMMGLVKPTEGSITLTLDGMRLSLGDVQQRDLKTYRQKIQVVLQNPYSAFNPNQSVYEILDEPIRVHFNMKPEQRRARIVDLVESVSLDRRLLGRYPHQLSGGQLQRLSIARSLSLDPEVLILDEPVTALDAPIRIRILNLLKKLQRERNLTYFLISHDLSVIRYMCDEIFIMYCGKIVERIPASDLFHSRHPYTHSLISAIPVDHPSKRNCARISPQGDPPDITDLPCGCYFHPRCPHTESRCRDKEPDLAAIGTEDHLSACHFRERMELSSLMAKLESE